MKNPAIGNWLLVFGSGWWVQAVRAKGSVISISTDQFGSSLNVIWGQFDAIRPWLDAKFLGWNVVTLLES